MRNRSQSTLFKRMIAEGSRNGKYTANSVIKNKPSFGFYPLYFPKILAVVINGQSFCNIALANHSPCVTDVGNIEHVMCSFFPDNAHASCWATAVAI